MLCLLSFDRETLSNSHTSVFVFAHERDVVLEHLLPAIGCCLVDQPIGKVQVTSPGNNGVNFLCGLVELAPFFWCQICKIVLCFLVRHARTTIRHLGITLRYKRVCLLSVSRMQVFIEFVYGYAA